MIESDRGYRWLVVAYTLLMQAVTVGVLIYCFALFALPWLAEFEAPRRDVMVAISLLQVGMGVVSPFAGRAMDALPMRVLVTAGALSMAVGLWLASHAQALWQILLIYALLFPPALALTGTLASQTLVARWFRDRRGLAIGISATGTNLGGMVFPFLVAGWLVASGWRDTLVWLAVLGLLLVVPLGGLVLAREPRAAAAGAAPAAGQVAPRAWRTREILTTRLFWIPVAGMLPLQTAFGAVQFNLGAYAADAGYTSDQAANLIALCSLCMIGGKFLFGGLGDRLDHRWLYWLAAASLSLGLLLLRGAPALPLLTLAVACVGLAGGGILPMLGLVFGARFGVEAFGRVMGLVMLTITFGAVGPVAAGWVYDVTGSYDVAFLMFVGLFLPGVVLMRRLPPPGRGA
ncbi:MAG: MFS transporter [Pseudomonadales bacterium]